MDLWLLGLGVVFMGIEFSVPGVGIFALASVLSFLGSLYFFMGATMTALYTVTVLLVVGILIFWLLMKRFPEHRFWRRLTLHWQATNEKGYVSAPSETTLLGQQGVAFTVLRPAGTGQFGEQLVDVVTEGTFLPQGTPIKVVRVEGGRIVVRKVEESLPPVKP